MTLSWVQIVRLGIVQMAIGALVVLMTSTLNRLMVVELALAASLPAALVALHYAIQITRPNWGFLSDTCGHRTRWIIGGIAALGLGAFVAAGTIVIYPVSFGAGLALSILAYAIIGAGVGASGTSLLALLATATSPERRAAAAMITFLMMILGIALTAGIVGSLLDPYSPARLLWIVAAVAVIALVAATLAVWGIERAVDAQHSPEEMPFRQGLAEIWAEPEARYFTFFVLVSMTAYFMQEMILEPYAGLVFGFTPGQSTALSGAQNGGAFLGMVTVGIAATWLKIGSLRTWVIAGCVGSAISLTIISIIGQTGGLPLVPAVVLMGFCTGMFTVAAIGSMMALAGRGRSAREGTRMGLWGAAQAIAAGFGGLLGANAADLLRAVVDTPTAFGTVFMAEAALFLVAAAMAARVIDAPPRATLVPGE